MQQPWTAAAHRELAALLRAAADGDAETARQIVDSTPRPRMLLQALLTAVEAVAGPDHLREVAAGLDTGDD